MLYKVEAYRTVEEEATITVEAKDLDEAWDKAYETVSSPKFHGWTLVDFEAEVGFVNEIAED